MITKEQLQTFCSTDDTRLAIQAPWTNEDYTFATDGRILVRVPPVAEVPDNPNAPRKTTELQWRLFETAEFAPLPELPEPERAECSNCGGFGMEHECPDCTHLCDECGGKGSCEKQQATQVGTHTLDARFLRKIAALPNPIIAMNGETNNAVPFKFDGGEGLVMPMRV